MRSKTLSSRIDPTLLRKNIARFWPLWAAYLVIWLLIMPVALGNSFHGRVSYNAAAEIYSAAGYGGTVMAGIFGIFCAMAVFSYLMSPRAAGMVHALPPRREALFRTNYLSGLLFMLAPNVLVFLVTLATYAAYGVAGFFGPLCVWLLTVCVLDVFFYSFAVLCAMLTGHILILPAVYAVLNFTVFAVEYFTRSIFGILIFGYGGSNATKLDILSPFYKLVFFRNWSVNLKAVDGARYVVFGGWWLLLGYGLAAAALALIAFLIYRRRHSETAGDVVAVRGLKPVFKYCLAFGLAITLGLLLNSVFKGNAYGLSGALIMFLCMLFSAFIGYFAAEMLMRKTLRVFRRTWGGYIIFCAVFAALFLCVEFDASGFERHVPAAADIQGVSVWAPGAANYYGNGDNTLFEDAAGIEAVCAMHGTFIENKAALEKADHDPDYESAAIYGASDAPSAELSTAVSVTLTYTLKDGKTAARRYCIPVTQALLDDPASPAAKLDAVLNDAEARIDRLTLPAGVTFTDAYISCDYKIGDGPYIDAELSGAKAELLYAALQADLRASSAGRVWLLRGEDYYRSAVRAEVRLSAQIRVGFDADGNPQYRHYGLNFTPTTDSGNLLAALSALDVDPRLLEPWIK